MKQKEYKMVAIDPRVHGELKIYCVTHGISITELVSNLVRRCISQGTERSSDEAEVKYGNS